MKSQTIKRPVVRYHGGKWRIAKRIIQYFPLHRVYVEPFGGGGSVLLQKPRSVGEVYNDIWGTIVNVFRVLRDKELSNELERAIRLTPFSRDEFHDTEKSVTPNLIKSDPVESARRTIFRAFAGFGSAAINDFYNTGFRANSMRSNTSPASDWKNYPDNISAFTERLQGVVIENRDSIDIINRFDGPDTLFYIDPPYVHSTRCRATKRNEYNSELSNEDHENLASALNSVSGMVVLSGYDSELYKRLYSGWKSVELSAMADGAKPTTEVLWLNKAAQEKRKDLFNQ